MATSEAPAGVDTAKKQGRRKTGEDESEKRKLVVHAPISDLSGVSFDKDAVYVNVKGSFMRREGKEVEEGEGEQIVMDLQEAGMTLDDAVKQTKIRLFGSSEKPLAVGGNDDDDEPSSADEVEDDSASVDDEGESSGSGAELDTLNKVQSNTRNTGRSQPRRPAQSLPQAESAGKGLDFASDSGDSDEDEDAEEGLIVNDNDNDNEIYIEEDDNDKVKGEDGKDLDMVDEDSDDDSDTVYPKSKHLDSQALSLHCPTRRDWTKDIYSTNISPEEIVLQHSSSSSLSLSLTAHAQKSNVDVDMDNEDDSFFFEEPSNDTANTLLDLSPILSDLADKSKPTVTETTGEDGGGDGAEDDNNNESGGDFVDFEATGKKTKLTTQQSFNATTFASIQDVELCAQFGAQLSSLSLGLQSEPLSANSTAQLELPGPHPSWASVISLAPPTANPTVVSFFAVKQELQGVGGGFKSDRVDNLESLTLTSSFTNNPYKGIQDVIPPP
ncbi:hypothetical protein F5876DRAFT_70355 [Lentinula aff. lateritia]|uniref:Uncharacterized protein n=1 Tax=Lentinula aff. lateritia TaxID=2804960 RepID=A0ACC1TJ57_9AGAR|nr:hypothetical protein F5876DRAFT_70355 [Lentinula aff. lateritia]